MHKNACCEILRLTIEMLRLRESAENWNRIQNLLAEVGPTDSYSSAIKARRQRNDFKEVPPDREPTPPF